MSNKFNEIFKEKRVVIGAIHFPPLLGYPEFPGFKIAAADALKDLSAFEKGGVDGIIIENNYDVPHCMQVGPEIVASMVYLGSIIRNKTKLPLGVSILWNDSRASLAVAKAIDAQFIRIPAFVDKVKTTYGIATGNPAAVLEYRKKIKAESIALFTDVQVKHSELLNKRLIEESVKEAINKGSDAIIITGKWTGDAPDSEKLSRARKAAGSFPVLVGSGADHQNIKEILKYADGAIVSTSLKEGNISKEQVNLKKWEQRIDFKKVKELVKSKNS